MEIRCDSCGATLEVEPNLRTANCPFCDSPSVVERPPEPGRPVPALAVGFVQGKEEASKRVREWLAARTFLAKSGVRKASVESMKGVYVPAWLYGAVARGDFDAEIGENYTVEVTEGSGSNKRTRRETRTEWRSLSGLYARRVEDVLVSASKGVGDLELEAVEPYDLRSAVRAAPSVLSGWIAEESSIDADAGLRAAREEARQKQARWLPSFMPGDTHRSLRQNVSLDSESLDLVLVPLWVLAARYAPDKPPMRLLVNGQTGKAGGKVPLSPLKITLLVLVLLGLLAGGLWWAGVFA